MLVLPARHLWNWTISDSEDLEVLEPSPVADLVLFRKKATEAIASASKTTLLQQKECSKPVKSIVACFVSRY
jgi:hypothetical protein